MANELTKEQLAALDIHIFLEVYSIRNEQGKKLDFSQHPFLWDMYSDMSPFQAWRKCAQFGGTTCMINKKLWVAHNNKMDMIYTMPTYSDVGTLVTSKVNRIIEQNPIFQKWVAKKDTIEQKRIGDSMVYYRGTWSEREALSITSDLNIHDEIDRSNIKVVEQYASRLQHSDYRWQWYLSNPSVPDVGVDKLWNRSDQKHWFVQCSNCKKKQYLVMENIFRKDENTYYFGCKNCKTELNRHQGEWIARWRAKSYDPIKNPLGVSGYWVSLLMCPWVSATEIKELERTKPADYFANFVLGIPYTGSGNVVNRSVIMRNVTDEVNDQSGRIVIGVDPGKIIRYVCGNRQGIFYYGECPDYTELEKLMRRWDKAVMIIDAGGDLDKDRTFNNKVMRDKFPNRVYLAYYQHDRKTEDVFNYDDERMQVNIDRNKAIQLVIDEFTDKRIPLFGKEVEWHDYWIHWSHIYRVAEEDRNNMQVHYRWQRSDRDDYVHATVYWRAGMDRFMSGEGAIIDIHSQGIGEVGYTASPDGRHLILPTRTYG